MNLSYERRRVLVLAGAVSRPSRTRAVAEAVCREVALGGSLPILRDLSERPLPQPVPGAEGATEVVDDLRTQVDRADALVWVTPCYHGSYSGLLKTCLDHLRGDMLRGKPVGLIAVGASLTAVQACDHLRAVARTLGCVTAPTQAVVVGSGPADGPGTPASVHDPAVGGRIVRLIGELHVLSEATHQLRRAAEADLVPLAGADS